MPETNIDSIDYLRSRWNGVTGNLHMPKKPHPGRKGDPVSLYPLTPDQALRAVLQIKPADVKRIIASKPGKKKRKGA